jgi:hypothetical protein
MTPLISPENCLRKKKLKHGRNHPWFGRGFRLLNYSPATDLVATGSARAARFNLGPAIATAVRIAATCEIIILLKIDGQLTTDQRALKRIRDGVAAKVTHLKREIAARVRI